MKGTFPRKSAMSRQIRRVGKLKVMGPRRGHDPGGLGVGGSNPLAPTIFPVGETGASLALLGGWESGGKVNHFPTALATLPTWPEAMAPGVA